MNKTLHKKWTGIWEDIFSSQIFKLDIIDGFKYRKKQAWFFLFTTLGVFSLMGCLFYFEASAFNWNKNRVAFLVLFFSPLLITVAFWFRACLIYSFVDWRISKEARVDTKKKARALIIFKASIAPFIIYYGYLMWRLLQLSR